MPGFEVGTSNMKRALQRLERMDPRLGAFVALLVLLPTAQAGFVDDPEADLRAESQGQPVPFPAPAYASVDIIGLDVVEEADAFTFVLHQADIGTADDTSPDGLICNLSFAHAGNEFLIRFSRLVAAVSGHTSRLYVRPAGGAWEQQPLADLTTTLDAAADTITHRVARPDLADEHGAAPFPGRELTGLRATCANSTSTMVLVPGVADTRVPVAVLDDAPDIGQDAPAWPVTIGVAQAGHVLLSSPQPFRASNGEATTLAYNVSAHNLGAADDELVLAARGVPSGVAVRLATDRLQVPAGGSQAFTVWVTVPFAHEHGSATSFVLEATSAAADASIGRVELGVRYLTVPQPAGHHDTLFVHTREQDPITAQVVTTVPGIYGTDGYLNTLEDDPADAGFGLSSSFGYNGATEDLYDYVVDLSPSLLIGLDADLDAVGEVQLRFGAKTPQELTVSGRVLVLGDAEPITLAVLEPVAATVDGETYVVKGPLLPQPEADLIPYKPGRQLTLELRVANSAPSAALVLDGPWLMTGSWLRLPLLDYHDAVEGLPEQGAVVLAGEPAAQPSAEGRKAPAVAWPAVLAALALLAARRRR